jgi:hypothetical protein
MCDDWSVILFIWLTNVNMVSNSNHFLLASSRMYYEIFFFFFSFINLIDYLTTITHRLSFFFFFFFVSHEYRCFSIWSYKCSLKHSREKKNWPFLLLIVFVEWTFLTLIRGDFAAFFLLSLFFDVSQPIYFTFFLSLRKNSLSSNLNREKDLHFCACFIDRIDSLMW